MLDESALWLKHFETDDFEKVDSMQWDVSDILRSIPDEEYFKIPLPYYAPSESLPSIPTAEDIEKSALDQHVPDHRINAFKILYRVNTVYAVKVSLNRCIIQVRLIEPCLINFSSKITQ